MTNAPEMRSPEEILATWREEAEICERNGATTAAAQLTRCADEMALALREYSTWLSEADARLQSGKSANWLRSHFGFWAEAGHARWDPKHPRERQYRALVVPTRRSRLQLRESARRAARGEDLDRLTA